MAKRMVKLVITIDGENGNSRVEIENLNILFEDSSSRHLFNAANIENQFKSDLKLLKGNWERITIDLYSHRENDYSAKSREYLASFRLVNRYEKVEMSEYSHYEEKFAVWNKIKNPVKFMHEKIAELSHTGNLKYLSFFEQV